MESLDLDGIFDRVVETLLHCHQLSTWNASKITGAQIVIIHKVGGNEVLPWSSLQQQQQQQTPPQPQRQRLQQNRLPQQCHQQRQQPPQPNVSPMVRLERKAWIDVAATCQMIKQEKIATSIGGTGNVFHGSLLPSSNIDCIGIEGGLSIGVDDEGGGEEQTVKLNNSEQGGKHGDQVPKPENNQIAKRKKAKGKYRKTTKKAKVNLPKPGNSVNIFKTTTNENSSKTTEPSGSVLDKGSVISQDIQLFTDAEIKIEMGAPDLPSTGNSLMQLINDSNTVINRLTEIPINAADGNNILESNSPLTTNADASHDVSDVFNISFHDVKENLDVDALTPSASDPIQMANDDNFDELLEEIEGDFLEEEEEHAAKKASPPVKTPRRPPRERGEPPPPKKRSPPKKRKKDADADFDIHVALAEERGVKKKVAPKVKKKSGRPCKRIPGQRGRPRKMEEEPYGVEKSPKDDLFHCPKCPKTFEQRRHLIDHYRYL